LTIAVDVAKLAPVLILVPVAIGHDLEWASVHQFQEMQLGALLALNSGGRAFADCAEIRMRAERRLGELLKAAKDIGQIGPGQPQKNPTNSE
jgi:hypothetical protein